MQWSVSILDSANKVVNRDVVRENVEENGRADRALWRARRHGRTGRDQRAVSSRERTIREEGKNHPGGKNRKTEQAHLVDDAVMPDSVESRPEVKRHESSKLPAVKTRFDGSLEISKGMASGQPAKEAELVLEDVKRINVGEEPTSNDALENLRDTVEIRDGSPVGQHPWVATGFRNGSDDGVLPDRREVRASEKMVEENSEEQDHTRRKTLEKEIGHAVQAGRFLRCDAPNNLRDLVHRGEHAGLGRRERSIDIGQLDG